MEQKNKQLNEDIYRMRFRAYDELRQLMLALVTVDEQPAPETALYFFSSRAWLRSVSGEAGTQLSDRRERSFSHVQKAALDYKVQPFVISELSEYRQIEDRAQLRLIVTLGVEAASRFFVPPFAESDDRSSTAELYLNFSTPAQDPTAALDSLQQVINERGALVYDLTLANYKTPKGGQYLPSRRMPKNVYSDASDIGTRL